MTTDFHRGSNESLIVEIIEVIPGTSKKKKKVGKRSGGKKEQSMIVFKITLRQIIWDADKAGESPALHRIQLNQLYFLLPSAALEGGSRY